MEVNFLAEGAAKPLGNTAQFPPDGLSTVPAAAALRIMRIALDLFAGAQYTFYVVSYI